MKDYDWKKFVEYFNEKMELEKGNAELSGEVKLFLTILPKLTKMINNEYELIEGEEKIGERMTYRILMNAKVDDVAYQKVRIWIDKTRYIALQQELYAASGKLLKRLDTLAVMETSRGWYPSHMRFKDVLKEGGGTEFLVKSILFDQKISKKRFKKGQLRR